MRIISFILTFCILFTLCPALYTSANTSNSSSYEKELLVQYKTDSINSLDNYLITPEISSLFNSETQPIVEEIFTDFNLVKYVIPDSLGVERAKQLFANDSRVNFVAPNDIRSTKNDMSDSDNSKSNIKLNTSPQQAIPTNDNTKLTKTDIEDPVISNPISVSNESLPEQSIAETIYSPILNSALQNPLYSEQWSLQHFNIPELQAGIDDEQLKQITVAVLDSGIDLQHEDLLDALVKGYDFVDNDEDPTDELGHGTHVSGIIGATNNDKGILGVASGVRIMPVRILNNLGVGDVMTEIKGIVWAANNGAEIINLSLGGEHFREGIDTFNPIEYAAIQYAISKGVVVVAAAGNVASAVDYPAAYPGVIGVSSINPQDEVSFFTNYGPETGISAPGEDIISTMPDNNYAKKDGTSMAAPFVSGVAALMVANNNIINPYELGRLLEAGADDKGDPGKDDYYGYGVINPQVSLSLPIIKIKSSDANIFHPGKSLQFSIEMVDEKNDIKDSFSDKVSQNLYRFNIDFNKSYGKYYYGDYSLLDNSIVNVVYGKGEETLLIDNPGFYEIRPLSINQQYAGNHYKLSVFPDSPVADYPTGYYDLPINVSLTTSTPDGAIYYTTNGVSPVKDGKLVSDAVFYNLPINISNNTFIKAITVSESFTSNMAAYWYKQTLPPFIIKEEEKRPAIETDNYILQISENGSTYVLELKDGIKDPKFITVQMDNLSKSVSNDFTLQLPNETIAKLVSLRGNLTLVLANAEINIPFEQLAKLENANIDATNFNILTLAQETAEKRLPVFQNHDGKNVLRLASDVLKLGLEFIQDDQPVTLDQAKDITLQLKVSIAENKNKEEQWYDLRKTGIFRLNSELLTIYLGGELNTNLDSYSLKVKPENQVLCILENSPSFLDLKKHWSQKYVDVLAARQIVTGINKIEFGPDQIISRGEFTTMLIKGLGYSEVQKTTGYFKDVPNELAYAPYIGKAKELGIVQGTKEKVFEPEKGITREEALVILMRVYDILQSENDINLSTWDNIPLLGDERKATGEQSVKDMNKVSEWAKPQVQQGLKMGVINGYGDGLINPGRTSTRAEASVFLLRFIEKCTEK